MKPNKNQHDAIEYSAGPSLIIAGAGTGKTFVITNKIKDLIVNKKVPPQQILALTFTEKAASEMEERVDELLPYGLYQSTITTFHGFADAMLREYGLYSGINPSYKVMTEIDAISFFRKNIDQFQRTLFYSTGNQYGFIRGVLQHFSRLRDEFISPDQYLKYAKENADEDGQNLELAHMYKKYEEIKQEENKLDFSDLVYFLLKLLNEKPTICTFIKERYTYCFVDEFQDTNSGQYALIKKLFPPHKKTSLTVIGDDNQSIYKFRGASISNILLFQKEYPFAKQFILNENYRSFQPILDCAYSLIQNNNPDTLEATLGISKQLISTRRGRMLPIQVHVTNSGDAEAETVAREIGRLVNEDGYRYNDCAILVRANDHAKPFVRAFERNAIPFQYLGPGLLYYKNEIRDLIALLRFLTNPLDSSSLFRVLCMDIFGSSEIALLPLSLFSKKTGTSLYEAIDYIIRYWDGEQTPELLALNKFVPILPQDVREQLRASMLLLQSLLKKREQESATTLVYTFLDKSGILKKLSVITSTADERKLQNITRFYEQLRSIESIQNEASVHEAIHFIDLALEMAESPHADDYDFARENAVTILTVHGSKGLEFPVVFMVSLVSDRFPSRDRKEKIPIPQAFIKEILPTGDAHIQEERRLFYVGLTRGKDRVYLSSASFYGQGKRRKKISPFVVEALGEKVVTKALATQSQEHQLSIFDYAPQEKTKQEEIILQKLIPKRYSYSQIELYKTCPLQYKFRYILHIPELGAPALALGSSVHKALELLYRHTKEYGDCSEEMLVTYFRDNISTIGFHGKKQYERELQRGIEILQNYYHTFYDKNEPILSVEQPFTITMHADADQYIITGKIDRISKSKNGYEIVDYKTGKLPAESTLKKSLQLSLYTLAAMDPSLLKARPEELTLTYYYLDENKKITTNASERNLEEAQLEIINTLSHIKKAQMEPQKGVYCDWCSFKILCPAWNS